MDSWTRCEEMLTAFDDLLVGRIRRCALCSRPAAQDIVWPVTMGVRAIGVAAGLCASCLRKNDASQLDALLKERYTHVHFPDFTDP